MSTIECPGQGVSHSCAHSLRGRLRPGAAGGLPHAAQTSLPLPLFFWSPSVQGLLAPRSLPRLSSALEACLGGVGVPSWLP